MLKQTTNKRRCRRASSARRPWQRCTRSSPPSAATPSSCYFPLWRHCAKSAASPRFPTFPASFSVSRFAGGGSPVAKVGAGPRRRGVAPLLGLGRSRGFRPSCFLSLAFCGLRFLKVWTIKSESRVFFQYDCLSLVCSEKISTTFICGYFVFANLSPLK